jgi:hypothetical protein
MSSAMNQYLIKIRVTAIKLKENKLKDLIAHLKLRIKIAQ